MTVEYSAVVATCNIGFLKLLFRWKGSIYKVVWLNLILYMMFFFFLSFLYRQILDREQQIIFEKLALHCRQYMGLIPLSFVLGFYVSHIMDRWWAQFTQIPWPDGLGFRLICCVQGKDDHARLIRRTIMRYVNLSFVLTMQMMCPPCKERFPTYDHMVEAGLLLDSEKTIIEDIGDKTEQPIFWVPLVWAANVARRARKENRILDDFSLKHIVDEICNFRTKLQTLLCYDWVYIPLVYTQVVTLAVYLYFTVSIMARQFLMFSEDVVVNEETDVNLYIPVFLFVEFFFYMGWLNVAETLVHPFGSDDDDFEINYIIDRNISVSYIIVDDMTTLIPEMVEDLFWDEEGQLELPYTNASLKHKSGVHEPIGSAAAVTAAFVSGTNFRVAENKSRDVTK